jgi:hypothetical protein
VSIIHIELRREFAQQVAYTIKSFNAHHKSVQLLLGACDDDCDIWLLLVVQLAAVVATAENLCEHCT